jgi:hypothetical protein
MGQDPAAERHEARHGLTIAELCDQYMADMQNGRVNGKKLTTISSDKSRVKVHIRPKLGRYKGASITSDEIETFMYSLSQEAKAEQSA